MWFKLERQGHERESVTPRHCKGTWVLMNVKIKRKWSTWCLVVWNLRQKQNERPTIIMKKIITKYEAKSMTHPMQQKAQAKFWKQLISLKKISMLVERCKMLKGECDRFSFNPKS